MVVSGGRTTFACVTAREPPGRLECVWMERFHWMLAAYAVLWLALAIRPRDRVVWTVENLFSAAAVATLLSSYATWPLSDLSYGSLLVFLAMHAVGAHYTYVQVPYGGVLRMLTGSNAAATNEPGRNHYDRVVHLAYGLLVTYHCLEMLERYARPAGAWGYVLAPALIMASSLVYEVLEWWAAQVLGRGQGAAYLGAQGDEWDAQKDMALATLGAIVAMLATAAARS